MSRRFKQTSCGLREDFLFYLLNETQRSGLTVYVYKSRHRKRRVTRANRIEVGGLKYNINSWGFDVQ